MAQRESWMSDYIKHLTVPKTEKSRKKPWTTNLRKPSSVPNTEKSWENPWTTNLRKHLAVPNTEKSWENPWTTNLRKPSSVPKAPDNPTKSPCKNTSLRNHLINPLHDRLLALCQLSKPLASLLTGLAQ